MTLSTRILLGLSLGLATGILHSGLDGRLLNSLPLFIEPIGSLWVNAIRMTVVPLIMALLVTSIAGQLEGGMLAKLGARTMGLFVMLIAGVCLYTLMLAPPLLSLLNIDQSIAADLLARTQSAAVATEELPAFQDWLVD